MEIMEQYQDQERVIELLLNLVILTSCENGDLRIPFRIFME